MTTLNDQFHVTVIVHKFKKKVIYGYNFMHNTGNAFESCVPSQMTLYNLANALSKNIPSVKCRRRRFLRRYRK